MRFMNRQLITGTVAWVATIVVAALALRGGLSTSAKEPIGIVRDVSRWVLGQQETFRTTCPQRILLAAGDPVLMQNPDGTYRQIGIVSDCGTRDRVPRYTSEATIQLYEEFLPPRGHSFTLQYHATPTSLDWVAKTIISPARQQEIAELIEADWIRHQADVVQRLRPIMREAVVRAVGAIEAELPLAMRQHRAEFLQIGERYESEILERELIPLVKSRILPVAIEEIRPVATEIAEALWSKVSLLSFTWRYLYDVSPLPERNTVKKEFDRFIEEAAIPELESRADQFVQTAERILERVSQDDKVRDVVRRNLQAIAEDAELRQVIWKVLQQTIVHNNNLHRALDEYWNSRETRAALQLASSSFEPTVRRIGDMVFGTREQGVSPEFARVLRLQILTKDRRWLLFTHDTSNAAPGDDQPVAVVVATEAIPFPIVFDARSQSPLSELSDVPPVAPAGTPAPSSNK